MSDDIKVTFDDTQDIKTSLDVGSIQYGQLEIGTTTTGETGEEAKVTNRGSSSHAILDFTIPRGIKGDKGEKGEKGDTPDLTDYATKDYVEQEIATFDFIKIVDELPETGLENRMYLVPKNDTQTQDLFDEYVWVNGKWEWITTKQLEVDLSDYAKKSDIPANEVVISSSEPTTGEEVWIQKSKNLIKDASYGHINVNTGITDTDTSWFHSQLINVKDNAHYTFSLSTTDTYQQWIWAYYKEDGTFISAEYGNVETGNSVITKIIPINCNKVRVAWRANLNYSNVQLEQGNKTSYEPYIDKKIYTKNENGVYEEFYNEKPYTITGSAKVEVATEDVQYNSFIQEGNICDFNIEFNPTNALPKGASTKILSGLPKPKHTMRIIAYSDNNKGYRLHFSSAGDIYTWYNGVDESGSINIHVTYLVKN